MLLNLICVLVYGQPNYKEGDTLAVFSWSGLNIRQSPSTKSMRTNKIKFGEKIIVTEVLSNADTIEHRAGNWVKISSNNGVGYVFDGFLSSLKIPNTNEIQKGDLVNYMEINYTDPYNFCSVEFEFPADSDKQGGPRVVKNMGNNLIYLYSIDYECRTHEFIFSDRREAELFSLLDLFFSNMKCCNTKLIEEIASQEIKNMKKFTVNRIGGMGFDFHSGWNKKSISLYECN
jgi:Bacterial SH3 domain